MVARARIIGKLAVPVNGVLYFVTIFTDSLVFGGLKPIYPLINDPLQNVKHCFVVET